MNKYKIYTLQGNTQLLDGGAMFGNAPKEMWKQWTNVDEKNRIPLACSCLLIKTPEGKKILFETGIGAFFEPKLKERFGVREENHVLLESLNSVGFKHEEIHAVVLSHLHFDHAGGCLSEYNSEKQSTLLFPNATYYVSKTHWERAIKPHPRDRASFIPLLNELLGKSGRLKLVDDSGTCDLNPFVTFTFSQGHTPGLMISIIHLPDGPLLFVSDLIPGFPWVHVPISMGYDRYPELVIDEKQKLLSDMLPQNTKLFFTHDVVHPIGLLKKDDKGRFFTEPYTYN